MNDHAFSSSARSHGSMAGHVRIPPTMNGVDQPPGTMPAPRGPERLRLPVDPYDVRAEKIRALRTELMLRHDDDSGGANCIVLLSPQRGEGRSKLAAELAVAFSQLGRPTLLVDADLRSPSQHMLFGADNRKGLARALGNIEEEAELQPAGRFNHLQLLPAGNPPSNPVELLSSRRFRELMDGWRTRFDFIVIDSPPVSEYSDGLAIAAAARRVLVLNRANHTPYREIRELLRRLAATQSQVVGAVVSHF